MTIETKYENEFKINKGEIQDLKDYIEKAKVLIEALPYIKKFNGKIFVIKYGGSAMKDNKIKDAIMEDIALMKLVGIKIVIVHGGGSEITETLKKMGIKSNFVNGLRITDKPTMEVVEMVLAGKVNKRIVNDLSKQDLNAIGICGKDGNLIIAKKKINNEIDLGFVGEITKVNTDLLMNLIENEMIPVIAPIGKDERGENTYNINADNAAAVIAKTLKAEKLVYLTDVEGLLTDVEDSTSLVSVIKISDLEYDKRTSTQLLKGCEISGGMIPKVDCCAYAIKNGVKNVHILDGRVEHSLLLEIFTEKGIGTMFEE